MYREKAFTNIFSSKAGLPICSDGEAILGILYECRIEICPYDNDEIKADFNELYQQMNGMPLREIDKNLYPVCKPCWDHEKTVFIEGISLHLFSRGNNISERVPCFGAPLDIAEENVEKHIASCMWMAEIRHMV